MTDPHNADFQATLFVPLSTSVEGVFEEAIRLLVALDEQLGPFDLRLGEDAPSGPSVRSEDSAGFKESPTGFMAISATATADVTKDRPLRAPDPDGVKMSFSLQKPDDESVYRFLAVLTQWSTRNKVTCAWAGAAEEERHHLFAKLDLPRGSAEAFVGRNHRKLVSGLFWWNYWSLDWLAKRDVSWDGLPAAWSVKVEPDSEHPHGVISGRFSWREWRQHLQAAEGWADQTSGVFSIREMLKEAPEALNELTAARFLRRWK